MFNLFLITALLGKRVPLEGRRWYRWVGSWQVPIGCQYKPPLRLVPFCRNLRCKFWLGVAKPQFKGRDGCMGSEMGMFWHCFNCRNSLCHSRALLWLGTEWCSNRHQNLVEDDTNTWCACVTEQLKPASDYGVDLWRRVFDHSITSSSSVTTVNQKLFST